MALKFEEGKDPRREPSSNCCAEFALDVFVLQSCPAVQRMSWLQFLASLVRTHQSATPSRRRNFFRLLPHLVLNLVPALHVERFGLVLQVLNLKVTLSRRDLCLSLSEGGGLR